MLLFNVIANKQINNKRKKKKRRKGKEKKKEDNKEKQILTSSVVVGFWFCCTVGCVFLTKFAKFCAFRDRKLSVPNWVSFIRLSLYFLRIKPKQTESSNLTVIKVSRKTKTTQQTNPPITEMGNTNSQNSYQLPPSEGEGLYSPSIKES